MTLVNYQLSYYKVLLLCNTECFKASLIFTAMAFIFCQGFTYITLMIDNPFRQILDCSNLEQFADDNFKFMQMAQSTPKGYEALWEKEKLLVKSNFSFSHSVFKRLELQTRKKQGLFGKRLTKD